MWQLTYLKSGLYLAVTLFCLLAARVEVIIISSSTGTPSIKREKQVRKSELPESLVLHEILTKLPPKSLMRFKCVSKTWLDRISGNSSFINSHLTQRSKNDTLSIISGMREEFVKDRNLMAVLLSHKKSKATEIDVSYIDSGSEINVVGSCDGLVCLFQYRPNERIMLWNPATQHLRQLPCSPTATGYSEKNSCVGLGFGFDIASKDYKVVKLNGPKMVTEEAFLLRAQVFAKSGAIWRDCGALGLADTDTYPNCAVAVEGALHWAMSYYESMHSVASFDLRDEVFRLTYVPADDHLDYSFSLGTWRNSLVAFAESETEWHMWASASSGGIQHWNKIIKFAKEVGEVDRWPWREEFVVLRDGCPSRPRGSARLALVDPRAPHLETDLEIPEACLFPYPDVFDYVESILSVF